MQLKYNRTALIAVFVIFWLTAGYGHTAAIPDTPRNPVVDLAGVIDGGVEAEINRYLRELEQKTSAQVAILTIKSLEGQSIEDFSISIAHDKWKLGQKGKDNGVLMVVSILDRKYRIEVGYGLEGILPDSLVGSIGRDYLVPYFKKGDYSGGIYAAALMIAKEIAVDAGVKITGMPAVKKTYSAKRKDRSSGLLGKIISFGFFLIVIFIFLRNPRSLLAFFILSSIGGRRSHWGGSGGGFGGGSFGGGGFGGGGGGFGGGGASGSW